MPSAVGVLPSTRETPAIVPARPEPCAPPSRFNHASGSSWFRPAGMGTDNGSAAPSTGMGAAGSRTPKVVDNVADDSDDAGCQLLNGMDSSDSEAEAVD